MGRSISVEIYFFIVMPPNAIFIIMKIDLCKFYILFATGFGGKRLRPFQAKIKYETAYNNVS